MIRYLPEMNAAYLAESQTQEIIEEQQQLSPGGQPISSHKTLIRHQQQTMLGKVVESSGSTSGGGRKKNSFEDDDDSELGGVSGGMSASSGYVKKEYYLKGGAESVEATMRITSAVPNCVPIEHAMISQQQTGSSSNTLPKSNLKGRLNNQSWRVNVKHMFKINPNNIE